MNYTLGIILTFFYCTCSAEIVIPTAPVNSDSIAHWKVDVSETEDSYHLKLTNVSSKQLHVQDPLRKFISVQGENGSWLSLDYPYCHCGQYCPPPPTFLTIEPNSSYEIFWDKTTISCEGQQVVKTKAESGIYRISVFFSIAENRTREETHHQFAL